MDNATQHAAADYEREIQRTIPLHARMLDEAVDAALTLCPAPTRWLDTGCGPGRLGELVAERCKAELTFADPSAAMLAIARAKHPRVPPHRFLQVPSEGLTAEAQFDVVTAIQCHHYGDAAARARAVARCFEALVPGGALVVFENVRAETDAWQSAARKRWAAWQRAQGREEEVVLAHLAREGTKFFPVPVSEHLAVLSRAGFAVVELLWRSYSQAGFVGISASRRGPPDAVVVAVELREGGRRVERARGVVVAFDLEIELGCAFSERRPGEGREDALAGAAAAGLGDREHREDSHPPALADDPEPDGARAALDLGKGVSGVPADAVEEPPVQVRHGPRIGPGARRRRTTPA